MGKLEERVYSNFFKNAVLRVTAESAYFYYYGLNVKTEENFPMQEIGLDNFTYLQSFIQNENRYMELSYDGNKKLYVATLCNSRVRKEDKKSTVFSTRELLYKSNGLDFLSIFGSLEECLVKEKYQNIKKIRKKLYGSSCFQICGSPKIKGVYIYEDAQIRCVPENEFEIEEYLRENAYESYLMQL